MKGTVASDQPQRPDERKVRSVTSGVKKNREYECPRGEVTEEFAPVLAYTGLEGKRLATLSAPTLAAMKVAAEDIGFTLEPAVSGEPPVNIRAYHVSSGINTPLNRVVIHTAECNCTPGAADGVSHYFQSASSGGSAQYVVDPGKEDHCLHDNQIAWHAPPNQHSAGIEIAGRASFTAAQWQSSAAQAALQRAAARTADLCHRYGLPVVWLSPNDLLAGKRGITGHVCVSQAWHQSDHTDPGPNFPVKQFLSYVLAYLGQHPSPVPVPGPTPPKPKVTVVRSIQAAVHAHVDGIWGKETDVNSARVRDTHPASGATAIRNVQKQLGLTADGLWGPHTNAAVHAAIVGVQKALGVTADGAWGPNTQAAFLRARTAYWGKQTVKKTGTKKTTSKSTSPRKAITTS